MKEKILIGICTVVCLNMFGQATSTEYFPIGTSWQEAYYVIYYDTIKSPIIRNVVTGDTIIEGVKYKCVEETQFDITTNTKVEESENLNLTAMPFVSMETPSSAESLAMRKD